jgi:hypothetical protein
MRACADTPRQSVQRHSSLQYSLYPRVEPPDDRTEPTRATLIPRAVPHPSFIPFNSKVIFGYGKVRERRIAAAAAQFSLSRSR